MRGAKGLLLAAPLACEILQVLLHRASYFYMVILWLPLLPVGLLMQGLSALLPFDHYSCDMSLQTRPAPLLLYVNVVK